MLFISACSAAGNGPAPVGAPPPSPVDGEAGGASSPPPLCGGGVVVVGMLVVVVGPSCSGEPGWVVLVVELDDGAVVVDVAGAAVVVVEGRAVVVVGPMGRPAVCACADQVPPANAAPVRPTSTTPSARRRDPGDSISLAFAAGGGGSFPRARIVVAHAAA
jgi:hypothetical protein